MDVTSVLFNEILNEHFPLVTDLTCSYSTLPDKTRKHDIVNKKIADNVKVNICMDKFVVN